MARDPEKPITLEELRELAEFMRENDLTELAIEESKDSRSIRLRRGEVYAPGPGIVVRDEQSAPALSEDGDSGLEDIRSPMVGTFYRSPRPGEPSFVEVGDHVRTGDALCIIEAMKLMNHIEAEFDAEIVAVVGENASPVEFGAPLFRVRRL